MKALVIKPDHLGDFAVALPSLWEASRRTGDLHVLASAANCEWSEILPWLPNVQTIYYPKYARGGSGGTDWRRLGHSLLDARALGKRTGGFDWGIELTSWDAAPWGKLLLRAAGARRIRGTNVRRQEWLVDEAVVARGEEGHQSVRLAARFPVDWGVTGTAAPGGFVPAEWRWAASPDPRPTAVMPWAGEAFKEWPVEQWRALRRLDATPWRLLAPVDRRTQAREWRDAVDPAAEIVEVRGIRDTLRALVESGLVVSVDTVVAHYAWLAGAPLVELFSAAASPTQWGSLAAGEVIAPEKSAADWSYARKVSAGAKLMAHVTPERVHIAMAQVAAGRPG